jgi:hypothetical protein
MPRGRRCPAWQRRGKVLGGARERERQGANNVRRRAARRTWTRPWLASGVRSGRAQRERERDAHAPRVRLVRAHTPSWPSVAQMRPVARAPGSASVGTALQVIGAAAHGHAARLAGCVKVLRLMSGCARA